ncbi:hypothetical protein [Chryseobacterium indologenes]|uniref:hypothetical protein n=1 Tax=Chryseobacterium indologenes TaxID=253 RepID=UPI001F3A7ACE|nr:hypothetical protein [Chryseobacterium indologenes]
MKAKLYLILSMMMTVLSFSQEKKKEKPAFNQELATSLGADKYGMKAYTIAMLTTGNIQIDDKARRSELMKGHMAISKNSLMKVRLLWQDLFLKRIKKITAVCLFSIPRLKKKLKNG